MTENPREHFKLTICRFLCIYSARIYVSTKWLGGFFLNCPVLPRVESSQHTCTVWKCTLPPAVNKTFSVLFLQAEPGEERVCRNNETQSSMKVKQWRKKNSLTALSKSNAKKREFCELTVEKSVRSRWSWIGQVQVRNSSACTAFKFYRRQPSFVKKSMGQKYPM